MSRKSKRWAKNAEANCTRRDFLKAGASTASFFAVPSLLHGLLRAETAQAEGSATWEGDPFIHMHLEGGYSSCHVALGNDAAGAPMDAGSLKNIGHADDALLRTTTVGALKMFNDSKFTQGFIAGLGGSVPPSVQAVMVCGTSGDDNTAGAKYGFVSAHAYSGLISKVAGSAGLSNSASGNRTFPLTTSAGSDFIFAQRVGDVIRAASFSSQLASTEYYGPIADGMKRIHDAQLASRNGDGSLAKFFKNMVSGIPQKLIDKVTPAGGTDAVSMNAQETGSPALTIYTDLTAKTVATITDSQDANERELAVVFNCLKGNLGAVAFALGGYDYHGNADTTTGAKDLTAGTKVGRACALAIALGKKLMFVVTSDGGLATNADFNRDVLVNPPGTSNVARWQGDRRAYCRTYVFMVNYLTPVTSSVVGSLNANGTTNESTPVGQDFQVSAVIMASYMRANGRSEAEIGRTLKAIGLTETQISDVRAKIFV